VCRGFKRNPAFGSHQLAALSVNRWGSTRPF
jgi:hypothetical protein